MPLPVLLMTGPVLQQSAGLVTANKQLWARAGPPVYADNRRWGCACIEHKLKAELPMQQLHSCSATRVAAPMPSCLTTHFQCACKPWGGVRVQRWQSLANNNKLLQTAQMQGCQQEGL